MAKVRAENSQLVFAGHRRELRRLWRAAKDAPRRAQVLPWEIWSSDPDSCPFIVDERPTPLGWTKIFTAYAEGSIEDYFHPRPAIVVSSKTLHESTGNAWVCPTGRKKDEKPIEEDEVEAGNDIARPSHMRWVRTDWDHAELLRYTRKLDRPSCQAVSDALRKCLRGDWKSGKDAASGTIVWHRVKELEAVVVTSCRQPKRAKNLLLVCPKIDDRDLNRAAIATAAEAAERWLFRDEYDRVFDLSALEPMLARDAKIINSLEPRAVKEIQRRILSGLAPLAE